MTNETRFSVLVSTDEGTTWKLHRRIAANTVEQACGRVQKDHYAEDIHAMFYATQRFTPRKMVERLVPKLGMRKVELGPDYPDEGPMPHEEAGT